MKWPGSLDTIHYRFIHTLKPWLIQSNAPTSKKEVMLSGRWLIASILERNSIKNNTLSPPQGGLFYSAPIKSKTMIEELGGS